ncbi:hypothetical protein K469DRAFT_755158 [Zopfia rhizophila CBS 207.26]|uniref:Azaphilone pigments biosynthesis cluster protein L N-terminal domain-containing protein n=1 Tax=Zopfia rhizophila CBS 207.26 TaxID=1314779 RepID=A0A6A6DED0_9PEZI|nr:hypothetical protein K469DRAFT_755158 [Zopfia rhizophila CBS 207.26]
MAAEAVGLAASVITIADVAYQSSKRLYELINGFRTASQTLSDLYTDLSAVQWLLKSLKAALGNTEDKSLSDGLKKCLQDFKPSMEAFSKTCDEFREKVAQITSHSTKDHVSWRDKVRLEFEEKGIMAFKYRLGSHKLTINIALGLVNLISSDQNRQILEDLQNNIITAISRISGQMEGLEISLLSLSNTAIATHYGVAIDALRGQEVALRQCLKMCTSAVDAVPAGTSSAIKNMETFDQAKQFVVLTNGKTGLVDKMSAHGESNQMFLDKVKEGGEGELVEKFFRH